MSRTPWDCATVALNVLTPKSAQTSLTYFASFSFLPTKAKTIFQLTSNWRPSRSPSINEMSANWKLSKLKRDDKTVSLTRQNCCATWRKKFGSRRKTFCLFGKWEKRDGGWIAGGGGGDITTLHFIHFLSRTCLRYLHKETSLLFLKIISAMCALKYDNHLLNFHIAFDFTHWEILDTILQKEQTLSFLRMQTTGLYVKKNFWQN